MSETWDGIVIGAGHNGLVLAAYAGLAGLKVLCIERRPVPGGGLVTDEDPSHPGFLHNTHAFFHRAITEMPWYADLELESRGARYLEPELNTALLLNSGESLEWWTDFEKTEASFARFSTRDAAALRRWRDDFQPIVEKILVPESRHAPLPPERRRALLEKSAEGRLLLSASELSPLEFVLREFENPAIQAGLLFFNGLREVDLRCKGFGHHIPMLLASTAKAQMCVGGSVALARALAKAVVENGGAIRCNAEPERILIERGRAVGVRLSGGEEITAKNFVASSLNPHQTFLDLIDPGLLPRELREAAENFRYNLIAPLFGLNLNLAEPPQYRAAERNPEIDRALMVILGLEHFEQYPEIVAAHEQGRIPATVMWGSCPTVFDQSQAPPGKHTAFMWEKLPYRLGGDPANWDAAGDGHGREMLELWRSHAPNLEDAIIGSFTRSPLGCRANVPQHARGRPADRRVHQRPDRFQPAVPRRGGIPGPLRLSVSVRLLLPSRRQYHRAAGLQRGPGPARRPGAACILGAVHSLSHPLGALTEKKLHHGSLNAIFLPHVLRFNYDSCPEKYERVADVLDASGGGELPGLFARLIVELGLPATLGELGVTEEDVLPLAEKAYRDHCTPTNPRPLSVDDCRRLYVQAL